MNTYRTRTQHLEPGLSFPARAALVLLCLGLIGGLLIALTPSSSALRLVSLNTSEQTVRLALSSPAPVIALPIEVPAAVETEVAPLAEVQPEPEPIPPSPTVAAEAPAEAAPETTEALADEPVVAPVEVPAEVVAVVPAEIPTEIVANIPAETITEVPTETVAEVPAEVVADDAAADKFGLPSAGFAEDLAAAEPAEPEMTLEDIVTAAAESAMQPIIEPEPEPVAVEPEPVTVAEPEPEPVPEPETVVAVAPEPEPAATVEAAPEPEAEVEPQIVVEAEPEPEPQPEPQIVVEAEPEPEAEIVAMPEPVLAAQPVLVAALNVPADDGSPVPYAAAALAPDEAVAMPGDTPPPPATITEKAPEPGPVAEPEPMAETITAAAESSVDTAADPMMDAAKAPEEPVWLAYARPTDVPEDQPLIAVVVTGLGLGRAATAAAIRLPGAVTLSFASHARDLQNWIDLARAAGHEVMLDLPMEPENYPNIDPGPQALLTSLSEDENAERLNWHLGRATGYVGVTHNMGSRFTASSDHMRPILAALKERGLMFLDARTTANSVAADLATAMGLPRAINNRFLDAQASRTMIDRRIDEIERIARRVGISVAVSHAYPVTLERLENWVETLDEKKLALVPVSAVANRQAVE